MTLDAASFQVTLYNLNYSVLEKVLIDPEKVAVDEENVLIESENLSIQNAIDMLNATKSTKEKARSLFSQMKSDGIFGRNDIMQITGISITAAGNLLTNLKNAGLIEAVTGYGKGKYKFIEPKE